MGNALSDSDDEGRADCPIDFDEESTEDKEDDDPDAKPLTDLCQLFGDSATLRAVATKVKEKIPENVILQHHTRIVNWLDGQQDRSEDTVTVAQFCDMLMNEGVDRADAIKAFHQFDSDGSGLAEVQTMLDTIDQCSSRSTMGELGKATRIIQSCTLTPAFVDVYADASNPVGKHGARILRYLLRNRSESKALPFVYLNTFNNIFIMRSSILSSMLNSSNDYEKEQDGDEMVEDMEKRTIHNCYTDLVVSSNPTDSRQLRPNFNSFWQSDGSARSHWIRLHIKSDVIIKHISIGVASSDSSYMPELVTISVGASVGRLQEIKEVKIDDHVNGQVTILRNMKTHFPYVQINIRRCHGDGCDTRIHGLRVIGYKTKSAKDQGISVLDASALWVLETLTSMVTFALPQSPGLRKVLLGHTKKALAFMPPLSLSSGSSDKPIILSKTVLQEIESYTSQLAETDDQEDLSADGLQVYLALNLAQGNTSGLIRVMKKLSERQNLSLPCADLLSKTIAARLACWEKIGTQLQVKCLGSDGGSGAWNNGPDLVVEPSPATSGRNFSSSNSGRVYLTDEGKTFCSMLFKAEEDVQLTKIRIRPDKFVVMTSFQVASGSKGPRHGLVFVYNPSSVSGLSDKFDLDEHVKYFSKYDFWRDKEFLFSVEYRQSGLGGLPDNPVSFFKFSQDCDQLDIPVKWNAVGQYIMVKFLDARQDSSTRLGIMTIKFFGIVRNQPCMKFREASVVPTPSLKKPCDLPEIIHVVLSFLTDVAIDQVARRKRSSKVQCEFLDLSDIDANLLWELHEICKQKAISEASEANNAKVIDQWNASSLMSLLLIHGLIPVLAVSKVTTEASRDALFDHLCKIINKSCDEADQSKTKLVPDTKLQLVKQIIIDGAPFFFPDKTKKRNELFKLLKCVSDQSSMPSMSLVFQSLCQFFSSVDPKGLLELPATPSEDFSFDSALEMMKSLLIVASQEKESLQTIIEKNRAEREQKKAEQKDKEEQKEDEAAAKPETGETDETKDTETAEEEEKKKKKKKKEENKNTDEDTKKDTSASPAKAKKEEHQMTYLVQLMASLQTALMSWCWRQLTQISPQSNDKLSDTINHFVTSYTASVIEKAVEFIAVFKSLTEDDLMQLIEDEQPSFLFIIFRQLNFLLTSLVSKLNIESKVALLHSFKPLISEISGIAKMFPKHFSNISEENWSEVEKEESVLRTWEVESPHDYLNNSNITQVFHCPGSTKFIIDFDTQCQTERRYDYLEFTDAKGLKRRFDYKVGLPKWPLHVTFSGPFLSFLFHSDGSSTEWGYKFTITAKGTPDVPLSWMKDLQLGLVKLLGQLCGSTLASNPIPQLDMLPSQDDSSEQDILRSDLWTSLFRGGYLVGKLQRSLSGKFSTGDESHILTFLLEVIHVTRLESETEEHVDEALRKQAQQFLAKCRESFKAKPQLKVGGEFVDRAIVSVFVTLVWHCQQLREDTDNFLKSKIQGDIPEGIKKAYITAESLRLQLASERQKWKTEEREDVDPAESLSTKCTFLLKFAGLTKVPLKNELRLKFTKLMSQKKEGNKKPGFLNEITDKYPSFRLVLEFVQDPAWTPERVHQLLQERSKFASALASVYMFIAEMVRILTDKHPFQIPTVLLLQEVFVYQDKFAHHYADGLDGCGLQQEAQVRTSYYTLVRRLVDAFRSHKPFDSDSCFVPAYDAVLCCLLHLLDVEWQPYDLSFVVEMQLPQLFLNFAKDTVKMRDLKTSEQEEEAEMKEYEQAMWWYNEIVLPDITEWFKLKEENVKEDKKALKMFIARFSDVLDVEISCDGCGVTLPGRRYRCLQCMDMDLCTACFSGGGEPEEHRDDHEIVHLVFKCNHCQAFIVGTRIHCNQCDDFDLCLGCHNKKKFPTGHTEDHDVTRIPLVKLKTSQSSNSSLKAYIHQHVWLLYSSLTLTLSDIVYGLDCGTHFTDSDYIKLAGQLQHQCITQAMQCLEADINGDKEKEAPLEKRSEETFARHSQERIMGLLGAVLPNEKRKEPLCAGAFDFNTQQFLDLLMQVAKAERGHELNTQHLAIRLLGRLIGSADMKLTESPKSLSPNEKKSQQMNGQEAISQLFQLGTKAFERNNLEWACSTARMLEMLFTSPQWKPVLNHHIYQCIQALKQNIDHTSIFPMFVVAGFPEVLTTGTLVNYSHTSIESQGGVILKHFPDKNQALIVDLKTRKRHTNTIQQSFFPGTIKDWNDLPHKALQAKTTNAFGSRVSCQQDVDDKLVTCQLEETAVWETSNMGRFMSFITSTVAQIRAGEQLSVERLWILSLILKVLNRCFKSDSLVSINSDLFSSSLIQALVFLACKGTALNQHWLLKDLEVLSLIWYTHDGTTTKKTRIPALKDKKKKGSKKRKSGEKREDEEETGEDIDDNMAMLEDDDDDDDDLSADSSDDDDDGGSDNDDSDDGDNSLISTSDTGSEGTRLFKEAANDFKVQFDPDLRQFLKFLSEDLNIDPTVLEALCLMNQGNTDEIIQNIVENFGKDNEHVANVMKKWKAKPKGSEEEKKESPSSEGTTIDTGILTHPLAGKTHQIPEVAEKETGDSPQNLFHQQEKLAGEIGERMRSKSASLLKKELERHGRSGSREYLLKVNLAMCVLYARHNLTGLLAYWPEGGPAITSSLLGCKDVKQIPCVLDLLYKVDTRDFFSKVVDRVIHLCDTASLVPIAYTAAQFMEEVTLSAVSKESGHNYTDKDRKRGCIQLPGATYLTVTFDSRCSTSEDDTLMFYTRQQTNGDVHVFSGLSRSRWTAFHVPGDTLNYKFLPEGWDSDDNSSWGYRFTVTAGTRDSFETGHAILEAVLTSSVARSLPLGQLWSSLVYVACKQASAQRLKAINLMLKVIHLQGKSGADPSKTRPDIDLCLLTPLWNLYSSLTDGEDDAMVIQSSLVGALTDLFLHAENLAMEWGMSDDYLVSLISSKDLYQSIAQGLINIAAVGESIQQVTKANSLLKGVQSYVSSNPLMSVVNTELRALS